MGIHVLRSYCLFFALVLISGCDIINFSSEITRLSSELIGLKNRLTKLEKNIEHGGDTKRIYLRIKNEANIRRSTDSKSDISIVAKGYEGDYLKKLSCAKKKNDICEWYKVKFLVEGGGALIGYVFYTVVEHEKISDNSYGQLSKGTSIEYYWEKEVAINAKSAGIEKLGVYIEEGDYPSGFTGFRDAVVYKLISTDVKVKLLPSELPKKNKLSENLASLSSKYNIDGILHIYNDSGVVRIYLYNYDGITLYLSNIPYHNELAPSIEAVNSARGT